MKVTNNIFLDLRAIQVDDYWVMVDTKAEIKENNFCIRDFDNSMVKINSQSDHNHYKHFKIVASTKFIDKSISGLILYI